MYKKFVNLFMLISWQQVIAIAWALMERNTTAAYEAVLFHFSTAAAPHLQRPPLLWILNEQFPPQLTQSIQMRKYTDVFSITCKL